MTTTEQERPRDADRRFRLAVGVYAGFAIAGAVGVAAALTGGSWLSIGAAGGIGLAAGLVAGNGLAGRDGSLPTRIGRNRGRRTTLAAPAIAFGAVALGPIATGISARAASVSLSATIAVVVAAWVLGTMARTRHVDRITSSPPVARAEWNIPDSGLADVVLVALLVLMIVGNGADGDWTAAVLWTGLSALWAVSAVFEGRWSLGEWGRAPEVRIHETGLVRQRPYARSFVPWSAARHVRVRDGALVVERGLFEVRFDDGELENPDGVVEAIERASQGAVRALS